MLTGDNGILTRAGDAKIETAVGAVKEQIGLYQIENKMDNKEVTPENLLAEGKVSRTVQAGEADKYYMYYALKENSFEGMQGLGKGNIASLKDVFLIDDNLNVKYISSNGKEYGDTLNNKVLEDETEIRFSSKAFSEYVSKISGVTEEEMKFKWMKNQTSLTIADPEVNSLQDLVFFPNLKGLTLGEYGNRIPQITSMNGIENCTKLTNLVIIDGPNKDYTALALLPNLKYFDRRYSNDFDNIIDALKRCNNLETVLIRDQYNINMKRISELGNLKYLDLSGGGIKQIEGIEHMTNLTNLYLGNNKISKIEGLENLINITELRMMNNKITKIEGIQNLSNLKKLYLPNNQIGNIMQLSKNNALVYLDLRGNKEIDGNRENYSGERLRELNEIGKILDRNGTIQIDADKIGLFTNYKSLDLTNQNLTTLDILEGQTQLRVLNLANNNITLEDKKSQEILRSMTNLVSLDFRSNNITNANVINSLKNLKTLYIGGEFSLREIEDIISNLSPLGVTKKTLSTIVDCDVNKITKLDLDLLGFQKLPEYITKLTNLSMFKIRNAWSVIEGQEIISKLAKLQVLDIASCNLHGKMIDFSKLTNLQYLNLNGNNLWSEDLENLKALKNNSNLSIDFRNNSIIDATALLELDPTTHIDLRQNINLSQDSKDKLKAKFGKNVTF